MINEGTRRSIFDIIRVEKLNWSGKLEEPEFLARIFDLESMPSYDSRFKTAARDVWQHRVNNPDDWNDDWIFSDRRFNLLRCDDEVFLKFLCEVLHPVVRDDKEETERLQQAFNEYLRNDDYELYQNKFLSGHPVYSSRQKREVPNLGIESSTKLSRPLRVFLCHASGDKPAVRKLYDRLANDGVDAWLDEKKLVPGQQWQIEIPKAVKSSDTVIVCLSPQSVTKEGFVQKEIRIALDSADEKPDETIFIIPARLENCDVPERIKKFQWVDLFSTEGYGRLLQALRLRAENLGIEFQSKNVSNKSTNTKTTSGELWKETVNEIISPPTADIQITQPIEGGRVGQTETIKGTRQNIPKGSVIWLVIYIPSVRRFFPQDLPADIQINNDWSSIVSIGQVGEANLEADIIVVLADKSAQDAFNAYLQDAKGKNDYPGFEKLPDGAQIYRRIRVIRK